MKTGAARERRKGNGMRNKRVVSLMAACVALVAALALAGCAQGASGSSTASSGQAESGSGQAQTSSSDASASAGSLTKVTFVLDYSPNVNHTGLYVAQEKGWFAEEGIEVEFMPVPEDGSDAVIGLGGADMGMTYQDYMANSLGSSQPMPYTAVAAVVQHNTSGIMSRKEDGITSPAKMAGHRYATWELPIEQATIKTLVEKDGASFDDVKLVPYAVDDDVMGLKSDMYDCVWVYEWWAVASARLQNYPVNYFAFGDMDPVFDFYSPVIAVNDKFAADNPNVVRAFLRAAKRGYEFAAQNPQESADILCSAVPELDPALIQEAQSILSPLYIADAESWGVIDKARWSKFYQWINDNDLSEKPFDPASGFTMEYLK